ncbi:MAG: hypothetical protein RIE32_01460 [Phycisphaerales bacterium]
MPSPKLIVQKFGGTSVADAARIRLCAQRAVDASRAGHQVVVVVSAMGRTTDALLRTAMEIDAHPPARELDQLLAAGEQVSVALTAIAIDTLGGAAVGLDARQAGISADGPHGRSRIGRIDTSRVRAVLDSGRIAVIAGFQGELESGDRATIGRGGSDTTAVAMAITLGAELCEIYTDAMGVMTADPALVPEARCIAELGWPAMSALSRHGARVLSIDAAEMAQGARLPVRVRHAALAGEGTLVASDAWPAGPVACATTRNDKGSTIALVGLDMPATVRAEAHETLGPGANDEADAIVLHSVPHERTASLLRELHAAVGLA